MGNHDGVVLLRNMPKAVYVKIDEPKAVYVKIDDTAELFLKAAPVTAATDGFPACRPRPAWSARAHPASPPLEVQTKPDFDEMRAEANIGATAKMPWLLPHLVGVEVT